MSVSLILSEWASLYIFIYHLYFVFIKFLFICVLFSWSFYPIFKKQFDRTFIHLSLYLLQIHPIFNFVHGVFIIWSFRFFKAVNTVSFSLWCLDIVHFLRSFLLHQDYKKYVAYKYIEIFFKDWIFKTIRIICVCLCWELFFLKNWIACCLTNYEID